MKLTLKLSDEVSEFQPYGHTPKTHTETIIDVEDVQFTRSLMGSFFRALADDIDPHVREVSQS